MSEKQDTLSGNRNTTHSSNLPLNYGMTWSTNFVEGSREGEDVIFSERKNHCKEATVVSTKVANQQGPSSGPFWSAFSPLSENTAQ